jgi:hypothetical protein
MIKFCWAKGTMLFTFIYNYFLPPQSRVFLEKLTVPHPVEQSPAFYVTKIFITMLTTAHHMS